MQLLIILIYIITLFVAGILVLRLYERYLMLKHEKEWNETLEKTLDGFKEKMEKEANEIAKKNKIGKHRTRKCNVPK